MKSYMHKMGSFHDSKEIRDRLKADPALAIAPSGNDLSHELILLSEKEALADSDLSSWANQAMPLIRLLRDLLGE